MSGCGEREDPAFGDRRPHAAETLVPNYKGVTLMAFSGVDWIMRVLKCDRAEAQRHKANAQHDFDELMHLVRSAKRT